MKILAWGCNGFRFGPLRPARALKTCQCRDQVNPSPMAGAVADADPPLTGLTGKCTGPLVPSSLLSVDPGPPAPCILAAAPASPARRAGCGHLLGPRPLPLFPLSGGSRGSPACRGGRVVEAGRQSAPGSDARRWLCAGPRGPPSGVPSRAPAL
jgi:hypothetical protein